MAGFEVASNDHLIRSNLWSKQLRELLLDDLCGMQFVRVLSDFPDGTTINLPSLGEAEIFDFAEGQTVKYSKFDTGNFTFSFDKYQGSANSISEKFKRDSFYSQEVINAFLPRQHRALMEAVETRIFDRANAGQTASNLNTINSGDHRWVGLGTQNSLRCLTFNDFAKAQYSLTKANVPLKNLVAIVDPTVAYTLQTQANIVNLMSPNRQWGDIVNTGGMNNMRFKFNIFDFDVYVSNYLPLITSETVNSVATSATAVSNLMFSATPGDIMPIVGGFRQMPTVYTEFNKDRQETEYLTVCEYGFKLYRPENMVCVLTDKGVVA